MFTATEQGRVTNAPVVTERPSSSNRGQSPRRQSHRDKQHGLQQQLTNGVLALADDDTVGVDGLTFSYPLHEAAWDADLDAYRGSKGSKLDNNDPLSPYLRVSGYSPTGPDQQRRAPWMTVQFNPARAADASGAALCTLAATKPVAEHFLHAVDALFPSAEPLDRVRISGLHLTRDFAVDDPAAHLESMRGVRPRHAREQFGYFGDGTGALETVGAAVNGVRFSVYDKATQKPSAWSAVHNLRWEAQLKDGPAVKRHGLDKIDRLTPERLAKRMAVLWLKSRSGEAVQRRAGIHVIAAADLDVVTKRELALYMVAEDNGVELHPDLSRRQRKALKDRLLAVGVQDGRATAGVVLDLLAGVAAASAQWAGAR
jgi:hypothetical protein